METLNAIIRDTNLGLRYTDHGILSFGLGMDYGGTRQTWGNWCLDTNNPDKIPSINKHRLPTTLASELLLGLDEVMQCDWEKLVGKSCRVARVGGMAVALGHYLEDKWLWMVPGDDPHFTVTKFDDIAS